MMSLNFIDISFVFYRKIFIDTLSLSTARIFCVLDLDNLFLMLDLSFYTDFLIKFIKFKGIT